MSEPMCIYEFGRKLIETLDLDPVYVLVKASNLEGEKLENWLLAYFCFYHVGTASWVVDQPDYWKAMQLAAGSKDYLRSSERRHFRGAFAVKAVTWLENEGGPTKLIRRLRIGPTPISALTVMERAKKWYGFGDWISFKIADMTERLGLIDVQFKPEHVFNMFKAPREGAEMMVERYGGDKSNPYTWAYKSICNKLKGMKAPPSLDRAINIQEVETILCKWHSHVGGHYKVGKDIIEVGHGLKKYPTSKTAQHLLVAGKTGGLW